MDEFSAHQLEVLEHSVNAYGAIQRTGRSLSMLQEKHGDYGSRIGSSSYTPNPQVKETAARLSDFIKNYRKDTPAPIQKILIWGRGLDVLESLANSHL